MCGLTEEHINAKGGINMGKVLCSESVESEGYKGDYMSNKVVFSLLVDNEAVC